MISSAMRLAEFTGIANPSPMLPPSPPLISVAIAELTPITRPAASSSGPPELPGLMAASVWIALIYETSPTMPVVTGRSTALMMPYVTVPSRPSGAPIAIAESPTAILAELPKVIGCRPDSLTFTTARS